MSGFWAMYVYEYMGRCIRSSREWLRFYAEIQITFWTVWQHITRCYSSGILILFVYSIYIYCIVYFCKYALYVLSERYGFWAAGSFNGSYIWMGWVLQTPGGSNHLALISLVLSGAEYGSGCSLPRAICSHDIVRVSLSSLYGGFVSDVDISYMYIKTHPSPCRMNLVTSKHMYCIYRLILFSVYCKILLYFVNFINSLFLLRE